MLTKKRLEDVNFERIFGKTELCQNVKITRLLPILNLIPICNNSEICFYRNKIGYKENGEEIAICKNPYSTYTPLS